MKSFFSTLFVAVLLSIGNAQTSRIEMRSITLSGVGSWDFNVYLPPGYDQSSERFPVLYLFRGAVDEWLDRTEDGSRAGRNIQDITDTLIAQGTMLGVILVMPGFTGAAMTGPATDDDYTFVLNTLIPFIDQQYRTMPSRWFRGVDGFSLGGLHMVNLMWRRPERFSSAGMYDGTLYLFDMDQMISADETYFTRLKPVQFLLHSAAVQPSNLSNNRRFDSLLTSHGIYNTFDDLVFSTTSQHNWWNADEHMIRSLPFHSLKFYNPPQNIPLALKASPLTRIDGTFHLTWSVGQVPDSLKTLVEYSNNTGASWQTLLFSTTKDTAFDWNTVDVPDGTRYLLRVQVFGDTLYGSTQSAQRFIVDNPGNAAPDAVLLSPQEKDLVSGNYDVRWSAEDPEGDAIRVTLLGRAGPEAGWQTIVADLENSGAFIWDSRTVANIKTFQLKLRCSDGQGVSEIVSRPFEVSNTRLPISNVSHIAGDSDSRITVNIVDQAQLTGHSYRIQFDDTSSSIKRYSVYDLLNNAYVLQAVPFTGDGSEGPSFDGLRLSIVDDPQVRVNQDSTRWAKGLSTLEYQVTLPDVFTGTETIKGVAFPADYEIRISDHIVDTSGDFLESVPTPLYYSVWNTTENRQADVLVAELDGDGKLSRFDDLFILEEDQEGKTVLSWEIFFSGDERTILPVAGDVFRLKTIKPLRSNDVFEFQATSIGISDQGFLLPRRTELSQNYPNPFNPVTVISYELRVTSIVSLKVYDLLSREIVVLVNGEKPAGRYSITWDASGRSTGIYFYQLVAGGKTITRKALLMK